jgi:predicted TIM-barrel fold metal-dependent hydrolase
MNRAIIDSHQHAYWLGKDPDDLVADMDRHGIALAWLLTWEIMSAEDREGDHASLNSANVRPDGTYRGITLEDTLFARDRHPKRLIAGFAPHPEAGNAVRRFEEAVRHEGVRVCGEWKCRMPMDDARCLELFRKAGDLACPVVFHLEPPELPGPGGKRVKQDYWSGGNVPNLEATLRSCPKTTFIGHAQGFWREISGGADKEPGVYPEGPVVPGGRLYALLERYDNLYADLSAGSAFNALSRDPGHARSFLDRFSGRLLFGRDDHTTRTLDLLTGIDLPADKLAAILFGNAERLVPPQGLK